MKEDQHTPPAQELYNSVFHYHAPINVFSEDLRPVKGNFTMPGHCHLHVLQREHQAIVIATEIPTNTGKSVTNAIVLIATLAATQFELEPTTTTFIEHYTKESYKGADETETYDLVTFDWTQKEASNPQWRRMQTEELRALEILYH
jgi:hypothetical protein